MKITKAKLKQIIKEELEVVLTNEEVEEMFGEDVRAQVEESEQFRDQQKMDRAQSVAGQQMSFEQWVSVVFKMGYEIDDNSPNPYDAWMSGQTPEEYASMQEKKLTKPEKKEKEKVVKGMKKSKSDFEKRYGDDAESVMYATATKIAKEKK